MTIKNFRKHLSGFRYLALAFIIFSLLNIMIFLLIQIHQPLLESLWLSADRPWGILTSAFTHAQLDHLVSNLQGFTLAVLLFVPVCSAYPARVRERWSGVFLWLVFAAGIGANAVEYPLLLWGPSFNSWGASGVVYGGLGVLLAGCIRSLPDHLKALPKKRRRRMFKFDRRFWRGFRAVFVMSLVFTFLMMLFTDPGGFLSAGPDVDVMAHGFGFLLGFLPAMVLFRSSRVKTNKN